MKTARIAGVGSLGAGDDSVGLVVAEVLAARGLEAARVSDASAIVELTLDVELLVIIDAVVGLGPPGTVAVLHEADLDLGPQPISTHTMSVPAAISFARLLYPDRSTATIRLVGVAIEAPEGVPSGMSPAVAAAVPEAVERALSLLGDDELDGDASTHDEDEDDEDDMVA